MSGPRPGPLWSLDRAKAWLRERIDDGEVCPCCGRFAKVYKRKVHATMARDLIAMAKAGGMEECRWVEVKDVAPRSSPDLVKCRYWGLIEEDVGITRADGSTRTGFWRLTPLGVNFVRGTERIPKYARIYDGRCLGLRGGPVTIRAALGGGGFNYDELMAL